MKTKTNLFFEGQQVTPTEHRILTSIQTRRLNGEELASLLDISE